MKRSQLKSFIKTIIKEVAGLTPQDRPGVMGAINVEEVWDTPEEKEYKNIGEWARDNMEMDGTYKGEPLHNYGFLYKVGEKIPLNKAYLLNAYHLWHVAKKRRNQNLALGKPAGVDEMSTSGGAGAYSTPFAFKKKNIDEMTSTGAVAGYATPHAFSKNKSGSPKGIEAAKKYGKVVGDAPRV